LEPTIIRSSRPPAAGSTLGFGDAARAAFKIAQAAARAGSAPSDFRNAQVAMAPWKNWSIARVVARDLWPTVNEAIRWSQRGCTTARAKRYSQAVVELFNRGYDAPNYSKFLSTCSLRLPDKIAGPDRADRIRQRDRTRAAG